MFLNKYGPWAIVTGASSGIGREMARQLAQKGLNLILTARRTRRLDELALDLKNNYPVETIAITLDLTDPNFTTPLIETCYNLDVGLIVSNAGFGIKGLFHESPIDKMMSMLDLNCRTNLLLAHTFIPGLMKRGRGGFMMTGSFEGFFGFPWSAGYSATKAFVHSFGKGLWGELKDHGIDVLVLAPGSTDTEAIAIQGLDRKKLSGVMTPEKVASLALDQLGKGPVYIPGFQNRLLKRVMSLMPKKTAIIAGGNGIRATIEKENKQSVSNKNR